LIFITKYGKINRLQKQPIYFGCFILTHTYFRRYGL
jgi:hypothetical protein